MMRKLLSSLVLVLAAAPLFGAWMSEGPKRKIETLTITANYKSPRLMAEIIQSKSRQPYILVPSANSNDKNIYLCMPNKKTVVLNPDRLPHFIQWTNPQRLLILGGVNYVPRKYEKQLTDSTVPVVRIEGKDWGRIAAQLEFMLAVSGLEKNFIRLQGELTRPGGVYRMVSRPAQPEKAAVQEENAEAAGEALPAEEDSAVEVEEVKVDEALPAANAPAEDKPAEKVTEESLN